MAHILTGDVTCINTGTDDVIAITISLTEIEINAVGRTIMCT